MNAKLAVVRSRFWTTLAAVALLLLAVACAVPTVVARSTPGSWAGWLFVLVLVVGAGRVLVLGVFVTRAGLTVRELLGTTKLPWSRLVRADVREVTGRGVPMHNPTLHYTGRDDGRPRVLTVTSLGSPRPAVALARADELNRVIQLHRD